jgi:hypothetical protein
LPFGVRDVAGVRFGLVQNRRFLGNSTDRLRALTGKVLGIRLGRSFQARTKRV